MKALIAKLAAFVGLKVSKTFDGAILVVTWGLVGFIRVIDPAGRAHFELGVFSRKEASRFHVEVIAAWTSRQSHKALLLHWEQKVADVFALKAKRSSYELCLAKSEQVVVDVIEYELACRTVLEKREIAAHGLKAA